MYDVVIHIKSFLTMVIYITASILGKMFVSTTNNKRRILPKKQRD